jgi:lipid A 3-O-deacylase
VYQFDKMRSPGHKSCAYTGGLGNMRCLSNAVRRGAYVLLLLAAAVGLVRLGSSQALAIEPYTITDRPFWMIDEVRGGIFKQAVDDAPHEGGPALNLEVLGGRFGGNYDNEILNFFLTPRPDIGTTIAFGKTDEFYVGVTWDAKLYERFFFEATFGGALHDGPLNTPHEASYGCTANFREGASLGFALSPEWRLMGIVDHMSNAGLCNPNPNRGLTNAGMRLGYRW